MFTVYIASPYSLGDVKHNVDIQIRTASTLINKGYCPIAPLLSHFVHTQFPKSYFKWMIISLHLVEKADVILRLPGKSKDATMEVNHAISKNIPVVYSLDALEELFPCGVIYE